MHVCTRQGLVFGVGSESGVIKLYDVRSYDKGPFDTFVVSASIRSKLCTLQCTRWLPYAPIV